MNQKHMDYIFWNIHAILTEMDLSPSILFSGTFCPDSKPYHDTCQGQRAAWHSPADHADFIRICHFFPASCLKILWGFSPDDPTLRFSDMSFPNWSPPALLSIPTHAQQPTCWKLKKQRLLALSCEGLFPLTQLLKNKITPSPPHFRK